ncbi:MAG: hypothetical protein ACYDG4_13330 [Desulfuromonadaceae bacterium]
MKDQRLMAEMKDDQIIIRVGIDTIKWALEHHVESQPYNEETGEYDQKWIVSDSREFAKDVVNAMSREEEDGTTPLIEFLDKMCMDALEDGSIGVSEASKGTKGFDC